MAAASEYSFRVTCPSSGTSVVTWFVGDFDPGREYLRVATGLNNQSCSVQTATNEDKKIFPVTELRDWEAALKAVPMLGPLLYHWLWG